MATRRAGTNALVCDCDVIHEDAVNAARETMRRREESERLADLYKMFADGTRVRILDALNRSELCVCDLAALLDMTKSAISHQLKSLRLANLVKYRRAGQVIYYTIADSHVSEILEKGFDHVNE